MRCSLVHFYFETVTGELFCEKGEFFPNVYQKKSFSGIYTNFHSFVLETYETGLSDCCSNASVCGQIL